MTSENSTPYIDSTDHDPAVDNRTGSETQQSPVITLLRNRDFSKIFIGSLTSEVGSSFTFIAVIFLAIHITRDLTASQTAQAVALVTLSQLIPTFLLGPFAGVLVDRYDRKKIMLLGNIIGAVSSFGLIFATQMIQIYGLAMVGACSRLLFYPARGASLPMITTPDKLVSANGIIQTLSQLSMLIGPALAGTLIGIFGLEFAFLADAISFLVAGILVSLIRTDLHPTTDGSKLSVRQTLGDLKQGFFVVRNDRVIFFLIITFVLAIMAISMINPLFAIYIASEFGLAEQDFGLIVSFSALSGFIAAIILTSRGQIKHKLTFILLGGLLTAGIGIGILGLAPLFPSKVIWLYVGMAVIGIVNVALNIPLSALLQTLVKNDDLGKVNGINSTVLSFAQVSGAAFASYIVIYLRISTLFIYLATFIASIALISYVFMRVKGIESEAIKREEEIIRQSKAQKQVAKPDDRLYPVAEAAVISPIE